MTIQDKLIVKSDLKELGKVRTFVRGIYAKLPKNKKNNDSKEKMVLAVNEAVVNIIKHAYQGKTDKKIEITSEISANNITISLYDWGIAFSPESVPVPKLDGSESDGLGIYIITTVLYKVSYYRDNDGRNCTYLEIKR